MSTLLLPNPPPLTSIHRRNSLTISLLSSPVFQFQRRFSFPPTRTRGNISLRAFEASYDSKTEEEEEGGAINNQNVRIADEDYPSGEFEFEPITGWRNFLVKLKMLVAFPWERVRKGSVLTMKLRGEVFFYPLRLSLFSSSCLISLTRNK